MAIPDPPKAGSPFCALWTGGWNPKTPKINNFFIPEITLRGGYGPVLELELLNAVWGAAHKSASLVRGPVRGHHGVSLGGGLSR